MSGPTNQDRAEWAEAAIVAFEAATLTDREDALADLLCDLRHWCDENDYSFETENARGLMHYEAEIEEAEEEL